MPQFIKDPRIDDYISSLPEWQSKICNQIRTIIHEADSEIIETIKFTNRPYFIMNGNVCALLAAKTHVNVFIYDPIVPDPEGIINQGHGNKTARAIQFHANDKINVAAFRNLIKAVATNNKAGGWRKLHKVSSSNSKQIVPGGVDEYIAKFSAPIQAKLTSLREAIKEVAPDAVETVSYFGIPGYSYEGYDYNGMFVWFSYDKKNIRLHLRPPVLENFSNEIQEYDKTKSILKFSPEEEIPTKLVKQLVDASLIVMTGKLLR